MPLAEESNKYDTYEVSGALKDELNKLGKYSDDIFSAWLRGYN
jgi:hypothetical protein